MELFWLFIVGTGIYCIYHWWDRAAVQKRLDEQDMYCDQVKRLMQSNPSKGTQDTKRIDDLIYWARSRDTSLPTTEDIIEGRFSDLPSPVETAMKLRISPERFAKDLAKHGTSLAYELSVKVKK